jgi:hypothetical protein
MTRSVKAKPYTVTGPAGDAALGWVNTNYMVTT